MKSALRSRGVGKIKEGNKLPNTVLLVERKFSFPEHTLWQLFLKGNT